MGNGHNHGRIVVTGATGLVGSRLVTALREQGWDAVRLRRGHPRPGNHDYYWNPEARELDLGCLVGAHAVIHLAGAPLAAQRWTPAYKQEILHSRADTTRFLALSLAHLPDPPPVLLSASAVGYYGHRGDELLSEDSHSGQSFLADVCRQWEDATHPAREAGIRVVNMRLGVVLASAGGVLARMLQPMRAGLGGILGSGRQFLSWIAMTDALGAIQYCLDHDDLCGPVNLTSPGPVTNRELTRALGRVLQRPAFWRVPELALKLALGEMAEELLLSSARVMPERLRATGYDFAYPELESALRAELHGGPELFS